MQDINSAERYSQFTQAVLESAEREASALISGAEKEKAEMLRAAAHNVAQGEYQRLSEKAERECTQLSAHAEQSMRRELLSYRDSLCKQLMSEVRAKCAEFCNSDKYESFLSKKLEALKAFLSEGGVCVNVRTQDVELAEKLCKKYNGVTVSADTEITVGGMRIVGKNKIYDETLDTGIIEEEERFLSYCGLKVV